MTFAHPSFLWALAGIAIPIAIHLLSRKEGKVIRVGSLRHLGESNTSQFKTIRLNEILLLILRCLMIASLVLFMSGARCTSDNASARSKWLVIEPGIDTDADYKDQVDSLTEHGFELRYLANGFPTSVTTREAISYRTLLEELGQLPADVVVIAWSDANKFSGERKPLPPNVRWVAAEQKAATFNGGAWKAGDSILVRTGKSNAFGTSYTSEKTLRVNDSILVQNPAPIHITISSDEKHEGEAKILTAAINVIRNEYRLPITLNSTEPQPGNNWLFWLREAQPKLSGDQQVVFSRPGPGPFIERISSNVLHLNRKLDRDVALDENLVIHMLKILYPDGATEALAKSKELNTLPDEFTWSEDTTTPALSATVATKGIEPYLVLLFLLLLGTERFLAIQRNQ